MNGNKKLSGWLPAIAQLRTLAVTVLGLCVLAAGSSVTLRPPAGYKDESFSKQSAYSRQYTASARATNVVRRALARA